MQMVLSWATLLLSGQNIDILTNGPKTCAEGNAFPARLVDAILQFGDRMLTWLLHGIGRFSPWVTSARASTSRSSCWACPGTATARAQSGTCYLVEKLNPSGVS